MQDIRELFRQKPYLAWYLKDKSELSEESVFEHILNYGDWDDFLKTKEVFGLEKSKAIFEKLKSKKRVNLRPQTINYFTNYFQKHA